MTVFIGGAWPYANGSLHLGHIASLLPGDIIARYYRQKGERVLYVSGSDCNGTPITIRARQEGKTVKEVASYYHDEFNNCFHELGFTYDLYSRTDHASHHEMVQKLFVKLLQNGHLYEKSIEQVFCIHCQQFLPDRYVEGECPTCGENARGDQCDYCSTILEPVELINKKCKLCNLTPIIKSTKHLFLKLSTFQNQLQKYLDENKVNWRSNAVQLTKRYLKEGLKDRAATRDLPVGVSVPVKGYENKKVYVWIEAVSGYLSASKMWAQENDEDWEPFWKEDVKSYYVHGKDNIPFHSIIWPAILKGSGINALPRHIVSSEYLTVESKKLSTSRNWAVWVPDILQRYHPDSIRYFLSINAPEKRDTDFSWREFIYSHNSELLGAFGNFVNRTLKFVEREFGSTIPSSHIEPDIQKRVLETYQEVGEFIEKADCKKAIEAAFSLVRFGNKYFDEKEPWKMIKVDRKLGAEILYQCIYIISNLSQLLHPFLPFSTMEVRRQLGIHSPFDWSPIKDINVTVSNIAPIFQRIDINQIEIERGKLGID
jgi:methionyl-tRNA synthetase